MDEPRGVRIRPLFAGQAEGLLRATLSSTDLGVMVTDLEHTTLAVNARFGVLWGVDPARVVESGVEQVRAMVAHRIPDLEEWAENLRTVYADPHRIQHDELEIVNPPAVVRRYTAPTFDGAGIVSGRLWTFREVSEEVHRLRLARALEEVSLLHHTDARLVYRRLATRVSEIYDSVCLLSIQAGEFMQFLAVGAPDGHPAHEVSGNRLQDSFCQFCLKSSGPLVIQDARADPRYADVMPVRLGLTRYAGVPLV